MEEKEIMTKITDILSPYARNKDALAEISPASNILKDLQVNSSRLVDVILSFEDTFNISIEDQEADSVSTVGAALDLIKKKLTA